MDTKISTNIFGIILATIGRSTLFRAIESILKQSYQNYYLIISCDNKLAWDMNTQDHKQIMKIWHGEDSHKDSGAYARNYAIKFVPKNINWITYIDCDDQWFDDRLQIFNDFINNSDPDLDLFYSYGEIWQMRHKTPRSSQLIPKRRSTVTNITCGGLCHKPALFDKTKGWNPLNANDHDREIYQEMLAFSKKHDILTISTFKYWK